MTLFTENPLERKNDDTQPGGGAACKPAARFHSPALQGLSLQPGAALRGVLYQEADREENHGKMKGGIFIDFT